MGDASTDIVLAAYAAANTGSGNSGRHRISHLAVMTDALISRMALQGTVAIPQLSWFHAGWEADMLNLLGPARLPLVGRFRDMLAAGVPFGGSTDFPYGFPEVGPVSRTLFTAATRIGEDGTPPPVTFASQTISTAQAIASLTSHAAWAMRLEGSIGSIRPGKLADFTLLTKDPFTLAPQDLLTMEVAMTMVDGQVSYLGSAWSGLLPP
jgi:predicted amidohydrolase YtcJ